MASLLVTGAIFMQIYDLFILINQSDITKNHPGQSGVAIV